MAAQKAEAPVVLIMAGGSGTRFWPVSQKDFPKQFLTLVGNDSLLRGTLHRSQLITENKSIALCGLKAHEELLKKELPEIEKWIFEPIGRNTAVCVLLSTLKLLESFSPETVCVVLPADHHVGTPDKWKQVLETAVSFANSSNGLITLGITPSFAHTGYGYIEKGSATENGSVFSVNQFIEKPEKDVAEQLLKSGNCYWNSGIFVWKLKSILSAFEKLHPKMTKLLTEAIKSDSIETVYTTLPSEPIDKAIMEKASSVYVVPADIDWSDLGSWGAVYDKNTSDADGNVVLSGNAKAFDSSGCLIKVPDETKVAVIGMKDVIVVEHNGRLLITPRSQDQRVKDASNAFE